MQFPPWRRRLCARAAPASQCLRCRLVIPYGYESAGFAPIAVFRGGGRAAALRPRRRGAAHLAAASLARDPLARGRPRRAAFPSDAPPRRAHAPRRPPAGGSAAGHRPARAHRARAARDGDGRPRAAADRLRLARRLRCAARAAEGVQKRAARRQARAARNALARPGCGARRGRARFRAPPSTSRGGGAPRPSGRAARTLRHCTAGKASPGRRQREGRPVRAGGRTLRHHPAPDCAAPVRYRRAAGRAGRHLAQHRPGGDPDADGSEPRLERPRRGDRSGVGGQPRPPRRGLPRARRPPSAPRSLARVAARQAGGARTRIYRARAHPGALAVLVHPSIDPVAFSIGPLAVRWYGLMYLLGFAAGWWLGLRRIAKGVAPVTRPQFDDLIFLAVLGVILGGRLGYVLFYKPAYYAAHPLEIFAVWQGGMSFHGGLLGVMLAMAFAAWRHRIDYLHLMDFVAPLVPLGLAAGRLGNFINGELWGRVTTVPWGMVFRGAGDLPRHPSQLYQFALEGLALFILLWWFSSKPRPRGQVSALFLIGYGTLRFIAEFAREPDAFLGYLAFGLSMGQWLCLPMIAGGIALWGWSRRASG